MYDRMNSSSSNNNLGDGSTQVLISLGRNGTLQSWQIVNSNNSNNSTLLSEDHNTTNYKNDDLNVTTSNINNNSSESSTQIVALNRQSKNDISIGVKLSADHKILMIITSEAASLYVSSTLQEIITIPFSSKPFVGGEFLSISPYRVLLWCQVSQDYGTFHKS